MIDNKFAGLRSEIAITSGNAIKFVLHHVSNCVLNFFLELIASKRKSSFPPENRRKKVAVVNNFFVPNEKSPSDEKDYEIVDENFSDLSTSGSFSNISNVLSSETVPDIYNSISTSKSERNPMSSTQDPVMTEHPQQTLPCILKSGENFTDIWNKYLHKIDLHPWSVHCENIS
jgi:hypothetical protein